MNNDDYKLEQELRALVNEPGMPEAPAILADFYERHGQLSRASLWRTVSRVTATISADHCVRDLPSRRKVMAWILCHVYDLKTVMRLFRSKERWIKDAVNEIEEKVHQAANKELFMPTLAATQRLRAARALPPPFPEIRAPLLADMLPPDSWPVTRPIEERSREERQALAPRADIPSYVCRECGWAIEFWSARCSKCKSFNLERQG